MLPMPVCCCTSSRIAVSDSLFSSLPPAVPYSASSGTFESASSALGVILSFSTMQVPAGTTVAALLSGASPRLARLGGGGRVRVLVNGEVAADPMQLLTHGDQVWTVLTPSVWKFRLMRCQCL